MGVFGKFGYDWSLEWTMEDAMKWRLREIEQSMVDIETGFEFFSNGKPMETFKPKKRAWSDGCLKVWVETFGKEEIIGGLGWI